MTYCGISEHVLLGFLTDYAIEAEHKMNLSMKFCISNELIFYN